MCRGVPCVPWWAVWRGSLALTHAFTLQNSLMKRVFVHESKKAFIAKIQRDGEVELNIIRYCRV